MASKPKTLFVVGTFPVVSETFIIEQVAGLMKRNIPVQVYALKKGGTENICQSYAEHNIAANTQYVAMPGNVLLRMIHSFSVASRLFRTNPRALMRALNIVRYGKDAWSLRLLYLADFFSDADFDIAHCHFGPVANIFAKVREVLSLKQPFVTTFYGYDASRTFRQEGAAVYTDVMRECSRFIVMSKDMQQRLVAQGFDERRIVVNPPGINVHSYALKERSSGVPVEFISVGRMVEKKGFDDLIRAFALVKASSPVPVRCTIVGDGPLRGTLTEMMHELGVENDIDVKGYMTMEGINELLPGMHVYVQPSKTDSVGNME